MAATSTMRALVPVGWFGRIALAGVWLVEGLWAKVLGGRPDELAIVASTGIVGDGRLAVLAIGIAETALALAILLPWLPRTIALVQTLVIVGFNTAGIVFGSEHIFDIVDLISKNLAIIALAWAVALIPRRA